MAAGALTRLGALGNMSDAQQRMALTRQGNNGMNWQRSMNAPTNPWQSMLQDPFYNGSKFIC